MIYLNTFDSHASYEEKLNGGGVDFKIPNVSYCKDANDVHFNPYNLIEFYVGEITGTTPQTVSIYTDETNHIDFKVSEGEGNKWYSYLLPKNKGLYRVEGDSVKKVVVKADIKTTNNIIIPSSTVEASFKGSNTSNVTNMYSMFYECSKLTSLDLSGWNTSNVAYMSMMFFGCEALTSLDLSGWDTSNVTIMDSMFYGCTKLETLDLSGWNTSKVTGISGMFFSCTSLKELDLSGWNTSNVTSMNGMFDGCGLLDTIKMKGCTLETRTKIEEALTSAGIKDNVEIKTT